MMPIRGYSLDFAYQLFSTFGPIPGPNQCVKLEPLQEIDN